jgi:hypothetical protein
MTVPHRESQKIQLTLAFAQGTFAARSARTNGVPKATAYRWSKEPAVDAQIGSIRRPAIVLAFISASRVLHPSKGARGTDLSPLSLAVNVHSLP